MRGDRGKHNHDHEGRWGKWGRGDVEYVERNLLAVVERDPQVLVVLDEPEEVLACEKGGER